MAVLYSSMSGIGSDMPDFKLGSFDGTEVLRDNLLGAPAILVIFMGSENPYIHHVREVLVKLVWQFQQKGVVAVAINSDDLESTPEECLGNMKLDAQKYGYSFPYVCDHAQEVARKFGVLCTPDFYLFDKRGKLAYHGQMDDSRPGNGIPVTGRDLRGAINAVLAGLPVTWVQKPSGGSIIRWNDTAALKDM